MNVYTQMHLYFCSTVLLFATPGSERQLPYKAFQTIAQLLAYLDGIAVNVSCNINRTII